MPPLADCFSARPKTSPALADAMAPGRLIALTGPEVRRQLYDWPGGTGKTQLAVYLAESAWQAREVDLLVWVTAASRTSVLTGYAQAYAETTGSAPAGDAETAAARFLGWLATTRRPWLVVLDDVAAPACLDGLWPGGPAGRVLVTTRNPAVLMKAPDPQVFPIGVFSSHEALAYLMARLSTDPDQRAGAVDLLEDLGREPLALAQASAAIASSGLTCRDYRDLFARRQEQIAQAVGGQPSAKAVTWTLSVERADQLSRGRLAQSCLAFSGLLDCHGIPGDVFTTPAACEFIGGAGAGDAPDPKRASSALLSLERTGLLTIDPTSAARTVRMHPVVQAAVRSATPESMRDQAAKAAAQALMQAWPADGGPPMVTDALRSCAAHLHQAAAESLWAGSCHAVLFQAGRSLDSAGLTSAAVAHWRAVAVATERALGPGHRDTLMASDRLAGALLSAGRGAEAVALRQRALDSRPGASWPGRPSTLAARTDLGRALLSAGRPADAIIVLEAALATCDRGPVPKDLDPLVLQDTLAAAYAGDGRYPDAIRLARRALAGRERRQGSDHPDTMTTRANLASACRAGGRLKEAIAYARRTLADRERVLGPAHEDTIGAVSALAATYHSARRLKDALPLFERALADRERMQGPDHPDTLAARANLAHAYFAMGRGPEAAALLKGTLADCERALAPSDPLIQAVRESLDAVTQALCPAAAA